MNIKYNPERLQKVVDEFSSVTELSILVLADDLSHIAYKTYKTPDYCMTIQQNGGNEKCRCCDTDILQKCRDSGRTVNHVCHAGLVDSVVPIMKNNVPIGYIMIGRVRQNKDFDKIYKSVSWAGEYKHLKKLYHNVKYFSKEQTASLSELALMLTSFILLNDIINIKSDAFAEELSEYIEANLKSDLSVTNLCSRFNVSKNFLYGRFHSAFNCTVNDYITSKRIDCAKSMLINSDAPISAVAEECGIFNQTYFCRLFKRKTGISPAKYRKLNIDKTHSI